MSEPLLPTVHQEESDARLARTIADMEHQQEQARLEAQRRARIDDHYNRYQYPYYYGTWRGPVYRPAVVYRDDACFNIWVLSCVLFWFLAFIVLIILLVYYSQ